MRAPLACQEKDAMCMQPSSFETGDLVQLLSGGPTMTVQTKLSGGHLRCQWFSGKKLESGTFDARTLTPVDGSDAK